MVISLFNTIILIEEQPINISLPTVFVFSGKTTLTKLEQFSNALLPISKIDFASFTLLSFVMFAKAPASIFVMPSETVILVSIGFLKDFTPTTVTTSPFCTTDAGTVTVVFEPL